MIFTEEQSAYINFDKLIDTKLIATAGSGKTFTIIQRMKQLIENKVIEPNEMLMLTFSRFTRDDFIRRIQKNNVDCIEKTYIKTIDSFAKSIIDSGGEVDVSILSYKFMKYLEKATSDEIKQNKSIQQIKIIFVDEAQDLNETQYKILCYLKEKNNTSINLIGDPNQNIYQFRGSSDKYLVNFDAQTFYLTCNFRSHKDVVDFSKYLRPEQKTDVDCKLKKINVLPVSVFYENEIEFETNLMNLIKYAMSTKIDLSDFAILSPTRGRMRPIGKSNGLCLVSNLLYKNGIKFKQFYEESTENLNNNMRYLPEKGHINMLTYMGSKGLEWKYTIIIDADVCLINKRYFTHEKHKHDQYLLYVACSRAINNLFLFSKCYFDKKQNKYIFSFNPWFSLIPPKKYVRDERYTFFEFSQVEEKCIHTEEKKISKLIDQCTEEDLYELAILCNYGVDGSKSIKETIHIFDVDDDMKFDIFVSKYIKELSIAYHNIVNQTKHKKYADIENIINLDIIMKNSEMSTKFVGWYWKNRLNLSWEKFDTEKVTYDNDIVELIEKYFPRRKELSEYILIQDGYYKSFIMSNLSFIRNIYHQYLNCKDVVEIRKYLFVIIVYQYSIETQHYFHVKNGGEKFQYILTEFEQLFNKMYLFIQKQCIQIEKTNVMLCDNKYNLCGEIDLIDDDNEIYELVCTKDISLKHIVKQIVYNILYNNLYDIEKKKARIELHYINFALGNMTNINMVLTKENITKILNILIKYKQPKII